MAKFFISVCTLIWGMNGLWAQNLDTPHVPGEILLTYEVTKAHKRNLQGKAILTEHQEISSHIQSRLSSPILDQQPVFQEYVRELVKEGMSEPQFQAHIRQRHAVRRGIQLNQADPTSSYRFSRTLKLIVPEEELVSVFEELAHQKNKNFPEGYRITDVSLNTLFQLAAEPDDPLFTNQYAHSLTGAVAAWEVERGNSDIVIGVMDTGIDPNHEDLVANLLPGRDFVNRTQLRSWQIIEGEDYFDEDNDPTDLTDGHGTLVTGVIAAQRDNGKGLSGVCPECKVLPLKIFVRQMVIEDEDEDINGNGRRDTIPRATTSRSETANALTYAVIQGADIINMSFSGEFRSGTTFEGAMAFAEENGVVMIAAAGNEDSSEPHYPAAYEEVIAVASTDENDRKSSFSSYGTWVDVSAPGSNIWSTVPSNGSFPPEAFTRLQVDERVVEAFPFSFTGLTPNGPLQAPISFVGLARAQDVNNPDYDWELEGKVALIERGEITFKEKTDRVKSFGAIGAIIFNNEAGNFGGTLQEQQSNPIPVVSISREEGRDLLEKLDVSNNVLANLRLEALFGYQITNGTSFAAPYVAGMAGLILANNPALNPVEVKAKILESIDNIDALNPRYVGELGTGRVNLAKLFPAVLTDTQDQLTEGNLQVFPNPVAQTLVVDVPTGVQLTGLRVINPLGQEMKRLISDDLQGRTRLSVDLSDLPGGYYIVQGESPSGRWYARVLKGE